MSSWPHSFATQYPSVSLSWLDDQFNQLSASGTSTTSLSGATLVGYKQHGSGASSRNVQSELQDLCYNVKSFGAVGDGVTDDTTAIQNAINAAQGVTGGGAIVFIPAGFYIVSSPLNVSGAVNITGCGAGVGSGAGNSGGSVIRTSSAGGDVINVSSDDAILIRDLTIDTSVTRTAGAHIHVVSTNLAGGNINRRSRFYNLSLISAWDAIYLDQCANYAIRDCFIQDFRNNGIYTTTSTAAPDLGDSIISGCVVWDLNVTTAAACIRFDPSAAVAVIGNKMLGANYGVWLTVSQGPTGTLLVNGNSIEQHNVSAVRIEQSSSATYGNVIITSNEMSCIAPPTPQSSISIVAGTSTTYLTNVFIGSNVINNSHTASFPAISIQDGNGVDVSNNVINNHSQTGPTGISVGGRAGANVKVCENVIINTPSGKYSAGLTTDTVLVDRNGMAFSELSPIGNGSECYVTDGKIVGGGNQTVTSGGTGCTAWRMRTVWVSLSAMT